MILSRGLDIYIAKLIKTVGKKITREIIELNCRLKINQFIREVTPSNYVLFLFNFQFAGAK